MAQPANPEELRGYEHAPRDSEPEALKAAKEATRAKMAEDRAKQAEKRARDVANVGPKNRETVEKERRLLYQYDKFALGVGNLPNEELAKIPKVEKEKKYFLEGVVDRKSFSNRVKAKEWYLKMADNAQVLLTNFDRVKFGFSSFKKASQKKKMNEIVGEVAKIGAFDSAEDFDPNVWQAEMEKKYAARDLYGVEGAFNVILAFERSLSTVRPMERNNLEYAVFELKLADKRSARQRAMSLAESVKKPDPAEKHDKSKGIMEGESFNSSMEDLVKDIRRLEDKMDVAENSGYSKAEFADLKDILKSIDDNKVDSKSRNLSYDEYARLDEGNEKVAIVEAKLNMILLKPPKKIDGLGKKFPEIKEIPDFKIEKIKDEYFLEENLDELAKTIALDVVSACAPADKMEATTMTIQGMVRANINEFAKNRKPEEKTIKLSPKRKMELIKIVLEDMRRLGIKNNLE